MIALIERFAFSAEFQQFERTYLGKEEISKHGFCPS